MGVSPWMREQTRSQSPKGATGMGFATVPGVPSGLTVRVGFVVHGLTPMATSCRHFMAFRTLQPNVVPKGRQALAMGVSPWMREQTRSQSPEGATGMGRATVPVVPSRLMARVGFVVHGLCGWMSWNRQTASTRAKRSRCTPVRFRFRSPCPSGAGKRHQRAILTPRGPPRKSRGRLDFRPTRRCWEGEALPIQPNAKLIHTTVRE